jgi:hypothetical protein
VPSDSMGGPGGLRQALTCGILLSNSMEHRMYEDLLKRLHAQELKMRRYHNIVGQPANRPLSLAGDAAAAIEALLAPKPEAPKKPAPKKPVPKKK